MSRLLPLAALLAAACATSAPRQTEFMKEQGAVVSTEAMRMRMRAIAPPMTAQIEGAADRIRRSTTDPRVQRAAIVWKLTKLVRDVQPDIVHVHDVKALFAGVVAARFNRKPLIGSHYGRLALNSWLLKSADLVQFGVFRRLDRVLANSQAQRAELLRFRVPAGRIELLPSCVTAID